MSATSVRKSIPANVDAALRKALEKLPADRFTGAQEFAKALADPGFTHGETGHAGVGAGGSPWNRVSVGMTVVATFFALSTGWSLFRPGPLEPVRRVERFSAPFLEGQEPTVSGNSGFDLSPDGSMLVYRWNTGNSGVLMVRRWDELTASPVRESAPSAHPAVSFDGLEVAFHSAGEIKVAAFAGGAVRTLTRGIRPEWGPDSFVYASTDSGTVRVPSAGGAVEYLSRLADGDVRQFVNDLLPGGKSALLMAEMQGDASEIRALDLESGVMTPIVQGRYPRYLPSGHLVYSAEDGTIMAARFDPDRMELLGTPIAVMDGVEFWSLADDGKLFYSVGNAAGGTGPSHQLAWVTRTG